LALAKTGDFENALATVQRIENDGLQVWALGGVTLAMVRASEIAQAREVLAQISMISAQADNRHVEALCGMTLAFVYDHPNGVLPHFA
jgi:hypothetical protein